MKEIFERIISINTDIIWVVLLTVFFTVEQVINNDLFKMKLKHFLHGIPLQACYMLMNLGLAFLVVNIVGWINKNGIGLFNLIQIPYALKVVLGVIGIDFVAYWFHRLIIPFHYFGACTGCTIATHIWTVLHISGFTHLTGFWKIAQ